VAVVVEACVAYVAPKLDSFRQEQEENEAHPSVVLVRLRVVGVDGERWRWRSVLKKKSKKKREKEAVVVGERRGGERLGFARHTLKREDGEQVGARSVEATASRHVRCEEERVEVPVRAWAGLGRKREGRGESWAGPG
jgi:hypothetical protein